MDDKCNCPRKRAIKVVFLLIVIVGGLFLWLRWDASSSPKAPDLGIASWIDSDDVTGLEHGREPVQPGIISTGLADEKQVTAARLINELLTITAEQSSREHTARTLATLRALGVDALPAVRRLLETKNEINRVFGVYLLLELTGWTEEIQQLANEDQSAFIQAEVAAWLWNRGDLVTWESFLRQIGEALTPYRVQQSLALLDQDPPVLEMPAGLNSLGLGESVLTYLVGLAAFHPAVLDEAWLQLTNATLTSARRQGMLRVLDGIKPPGYKNALAAIFSRPDEDINVRWLALVYLGEIGNAEDRRFLQAYMEAHPDDVLGKALTNAMDRLATRAPP